MTEFDIDLSYFGVPDVTGVIAPVRVKQVGIQRFESILAYAYFWTGLNYLVAHYVRTLFIVPSAGPFTFFLIIPLKAILWPIVLPLEWFGLKFVAKFFGTKGTLKPPYWLKWIAPEVYQGMMAIYNEGAKATTE